MRGRSGAGLVAIAITTIAVACHADAGVLWENQGSHATLILEQEVGEDVAAATEYQFALVRNIMVTPGGTMWVVDGSSAPGVPGSSLIRLYDSQGRYLGQAGGPGSGPGEYRDPIRLALMADGRVALRDAVLGDRITLYSGEGALDTTWSLGRQFRRGRNPAVAVDTRGIVWVSTIELTRPRPTGRYLRLRYGSVLDTVALPALPEVELNQMSLTRTFASGRKEEIQHMVPYSPGLALTWLPSGSFAIARTADYRIEILPPPDASATAESRFVTRAIDPVPVSETERAALRRELVALREEAGDPISTGIPEIPHYKPHIRYLLASADGRLLVFVSMPSHVRDNEWAEPEAFDAFSPEGRFVGRVVLPDSFAFAYMRGDLMWGVFHGEYDVESIRRYRIEWPNE